MLTTVAQMFTYALEMINKENTGTITPTEFNVLINAAQVDYVLQKARGVDVNQRAMDSLRVLIPLPLVINNTGAQVNEQEVFPLPYVANPPAGVSHGYLHMLNCAVKLQRGNPPAPVACQAPDGWASCRPLPRDSRHDIKENPYWRPSDEAPYYYTTGNEVRVWTNSDAFADQMRIEYLRYPVRIDVIGPVQPELPAHVNQEITDLMVRGYLEVTENPRFRTHVANTQLKA